MFYILLILIACTVALLFVPRLKTWRTAIFGAATTVIGAMLPVLSQIFDFLNGLDWRQYVSDRNWLIAIIGGLGIAVIVLRHITASPAAWRK